MSDTIGMFKLEEYMAKPPQNNTRRKRRFKKSSEEVNR
jgi:hypothetical protein